MVLVAVLFSDSFEEGLTNGVNVCSFNDGVAATPVLDSASTDGTDGVVGTLPLFLVGSSMWLQASGIVVERTSVRGKS